LSAEKVSASDKQVVDLEKTTLDTTNLKNEHQKEKEELQKEKKELDASLKNMAVEHENQRGQKFTMVCTLSVVAGFCFVFSTAPSL
jgi:uncharacterized protein YlxW (UPF0749 family)